MKKIILTLALFTGAVSLPAAVIINVYESGSDVIMEGSGSLDISGLNSNGNYEVGNWQTIPDQGWLRVGSTPTMLTYYIIETSPGSFGTGGGVTADFGSGNSLQATPYADIGVEVGYVSGTMMAFSSTFSGATFQSLGFTEGTYVWSWAADSITMNVAAVPEPAAYGLMAGALMLGLACCKRKGRPVSAAACEAV
jgi:hypothetical protein